MSLLPGELRSAQAPCSPTKRDITLHLMPERTDVLSEKSNSITLKTRAHMRAVHIFVEKFGCVQHQMADPRSADVAYTPEVPPRPA